MSEGTMLTEPPPGVPAATAEQLEQLLEAHRRELIAHCRRVLGSASEADDAVQETLVRAWRAFDRFGGRSTLRTWLYRIATNVCLDMLDAAQRRAHPTDPVRWTAPEVPEDRPGADRSESFLGRHPSQHDEDPAERAVAHESVRRAFGAALLHLPPRQRAVLLLREVLRWRAVEVAELLGATVVSVNSSLQRARATLARTDVAGGPEAPVDPADLARLQRFVEAFDHADLDALVSLLLPRPPS